MSLASVLENTVFRFDKVTPAGWTGLAVLVLFGAALLFAARTVKWNARMLATGALCVALAFVLSYVRLYKMPQGGSVTAGSMLPILLFAFAFGGMPGLLCGFVYGGLQLIQDPYFVHPVQITLDYFAAFTAIGVCGFFRDSGLPKDAALPVGVAVAGLARIACHVIAGAVFFAEYAGEQNPWVYSMIYNFTSVGLDTLICVVLALLHPVRRIADILSQRAAQGGINA